MVLGPCTRLIRDLGTRIQFNWRALMQAEAIQSSYVNELGLPIRVESEDGETYVVDVFRASFENIRRLWDVFNRFEILRTDDAPKTLREFTSQVLSRGFVILQVSDVGVIYLTQIRPGLSAEFHPLFWDKKTAGKHRVMMVVGRLLMDYFNLHRLELVVPKYAWAALRRLLKMGVCIEGVEREGALYKGRWADVLRFAVLRHELTDEAIEEGKLARTREESMWYGLLKDDEKLRSFVLGRVLRDERTDEAEDSRD
jgi:RimJ/RimL family protein N-acetyltransferase